MVSKSKQKREAQTITSSDVAVASPVLVGQTARRRLMNFPGRAGAPKPHRAGTKRALVVEMLTRPEGATFKQVQDSVAAKFPGGEWDAKTTTEGIKLISVALGYQLTEDPQTGIIRARVA